MVPDNSYVAYISINIVYASLATLFLIKTWEILERHMHKRKELVNDNVKCQKRLGIDFVRDRERLFIQAVKTKKNFSNDCLTNRSLFRRY